MRESIRRSRLYRFTGKVLKCVSKMPVLMFCLGILFGFYICLAGLHKVGVTGYRHSFHVLAEIVAEDMWHPSSEQEYDAKVIISCDPTKKVGVKWRRRKDASLSVSIITDKREE